MTTYDDQTARDIARIDAITRANSAFASFDDLLDAAGDYRPTIDVDAPDRLLLADAYDAVQANRGDDRRAHRSGARKRDSIIASLVTADTARRASNA